MRWMEMSWNCYNRKTEYCEEECEIIDYTSWEYLKELEMERCRFTVEDVYNEMWDEE